MATSACYRHPDRKAINRCYYCKRPICKECRLHLGHHYFCSRRCYRLFVLRDQLNRFKKYQGRILWGWRALVTIMIVSMLIFLVRATRHSNADAEYTDVDSLTNSVEQPAWVSEALSASDQAVIVHRKTVEEGAYTVNLPVQSGWVVTVWRNDWPVHSAIVHRRGTFRLNVPLNLGQNQIRIQVLDNGKTIVTELLEINYRNPTVRALRRSVESVRTRYPFVALTFDGGSSAEGADSILAVLKRYGIQVTMFLTGQFIQRYPHLVRQIVADGHQVGNHTYSHPHLTTYAQNGRHLTRKGITRDFFRHQLLVTDSLFYQLTGKHMAPLWRAPFGEINREILTWAAELGYLHIGWSRGLDTFDWVSDSASPLYHTPTETLHRILFHNGRPRSLAGKIVLMHLGNHRAQPVYRMLPALLDSLQRRGLTVVPVQRLLTPNS